MWLIARKRAASDKSDHLLCLRADGSRTEVDLPRQGILAHDLLHALVESALGFSDGFLGLVAKGAEIGFLSKSLHQFADPARQLEAGQAECVVEALQTQLWAGVFSEPAFRYGVETACAMRRVPLPALARVASWQAVFDQAVELSAQWTQMPAHAEWRLQFPQSFVRTH